MIDLEHFRKIAAEPFRNGNGYYSCNCGEDLEEAVKEIERLRKVIAAITIGRKRDDTD